MPFFFEIPPIVDFFTLWCSLNNGENPFFFCSQSFSKCHASCLATRQKERKQQTGVSELIAPPKTDMIMGNPYFQSEIHLQMVHVSFWVVYQGFCCSFFLNSPPQTCRMLLSWTNFEISWGAPGFFYGNKESSSQNPGYFVKDPMYLKLISHMPV